MLRSVFCECRTEEERNQLKIIFAHFFCHRVLSETLNFMTRAWVSRFAGACLSQPTVAICAFWDLISSSILRTQGLIRFFQFPEKKKKKKHK
jgi:hypothetical protein